MIESDYVPDVGDFMRPRPAGNAHITEYVQHTGTGTPVVVMACGKEWRTSALEAAPENPARPCRACWEAMCS